MNEVQEICESLDAALFSGDVFNSHAALDLLEAYLESWKRKSQEIRSWLNEV